MDSIAIASARLDRYNDVQPEVMPGDFDYMPQFAANLHYLFSELSFLDRFEMCKLPVSLAATNRRLGKSTYPYLFDLLDELGYRGWVGCEYRPKGDTWFGLSWATKYGIQNVRPSSEK